MFKILSDLSLVLRRELPIDTASNSYHVLTSGISGVWVTLDSSGYAVRTSTSGNQLSWPIFNDSLRTGAVGWTPDVTTTNKVTVLMGNFVAATDQYTGVSAVGTMLTAGANGKLVAGTVGTDQIVGMVSKAPYTDAFTGLTVIDFIATT